MFIILFADTPLLLISPTILHLSLIQGGQGGTRVLVPLPLCPLKHTRSTSHHPTLN
ncbi:hypothetical protein BDZ45DRAFT_651339 [Acephala macrosclerotiorum]|nr:hypothetical protein BDZ45DRAFT_651339 [Acephala macrosclerotiorum]